MNFSAVLMGNLINVVNLHEDQRQRASTRLLLLAMSSCLLQLFHRLQAKFRFSSAGSVAGEHLLEGRRDLLRDDFNNSAVTLCERAQFDRINRKDTNQFVAIEERGAEAASKSMPRHASGVAKVQNRVRVADCLTICRNPATQSLAELNA